jgi:zinc/manganese transport system permease protein
MSEFELSIIFPAFIACLLVLSTHVPLGMEVLRRGIIFIDLAIAQVAGLGVIAADTMGWEARGWMVQFAAVSAALVAAGISCTGRTNAGPRSRKRSSACRSCSRRPPAS